jgi:nucleotide-binding universal stress UspA family protein
VLERNPRTESRAAASLFNTAQKLPALRLKKILATTDFSKISLVGVRYAVSLADKVDAGVALVHVIEPAPRFAGMESVVLAKDDADVIELAERELARLAEKESKKDLAVQSFVRHGKPFNEIAALARSREADLVVIATRGYTGLKNIWLGSTAEQVVRHAPCAVLTVPPQNAKAAAFQLKRIVVPIDFSETSAQALPYAAALAEQFGAEIILLHVIEWVAIPSELGSAPSAITEADKGSVAKDLSRLRQEVLGEQVPGRTIVRAGAPFQEITRAAKEMGADMIILTTRGYTGLQNILLGSTAERVVRHAECPVLVVRKKVSGRKRLFARKGRKKSVKK